MSVMVDLTLRHFAKSRGEITGVGTWLKIDEQWRPAMVLLRAGHELNRDFTPYLITMDKAWIWDSTHGDGRQCAAQCFKIAQALRLDVDDPRVIFRIRSFIDDHLHDLLTIPPLPPKARPGKVIAEVTVTNRTTGATREIELTDV